LQGGDDAVADRPALGGQGGQGGEDAVFELAVSLVGGEKGDLVYLCGCPHRWIYADAAAMPRGFVCGFLLAW
jgi:hypothetical protein